jgi:hypothetical protein
MTPGSDASISTALAALEKTSANAPARIEVEFMFIGLPQSDNS